MSQPEQEPLDMVVHAVAPWRDVIASNNHMETLSCGHVLVPPPVEVQSRRRCEQCQRMSE